MERIIFILGGLISVLISRTDTYKCLSCRASARPRDCEYVQECGQHEKCSIESYLTTSGYIRFDLGCMDIYKCAAFGSKRAALNATVLEEIKQKDTFAVVPDVQWDDYNKDTLQCAECCTNELCNAQGCGEAGYPLDSGPICYNCAQERRPDACNQIKMCGRDDACYLSYNVVGSDLVYRSECTPKQSCQGSLDKGPIVGRRQENIEMMRDKRVTLCHKCCSDDLCNLDNCTSSTHTNAISNPPMTTDSVTIAPVFSHSVDGQWSAWTAWGICSQTCGTGGITARQRTCNNPAPSAGGKNCVGGHVETHNCSGSQEPQVIQSAQNFTKPIGSQIVIPCLVSSGTAPPQATQIIWIAPQIVGHPVPTNVAQLPDGSLSIDRLTLENVGPYSCRLTTNCGTYDSAKFWVNIQ